MYEYRLTETKCNINHGAILKILNDIFYLYTINTDMNIQQIISLCVEKYEVDCSYKNESSALSFWRLNF